jgi:hypothetical protein
MAWWREGREAEKSKILSDDMLGGILKAPRGRGGAPWSPSTFGDGAPPPNTPGTPLSLELPPMPQSLLPGKKEG